MEPAGDKGAISDERVLPHGPRLLPDWAGFAASSGDCLLYGRTVIQPYEQAQKSGNLGHSGGAKREKGVKLVNNHRKSRSAASAGNDGIFTTEGYGWVRRCPSERAAGGDFGQEKSGPVDLFGSPCGQEADPGEADQSLMERPWRSPGTEQPPPGAGGATARPWQHQ